MQRKERKTKGRGSTYALSGVCLSSQHIILPCFTASALLALLEAEDLLQGRLCLFYEEALTLWSDKEREMYSRDDLRLTPMER